MTMAFAWRKHPFLRNWGWFCGAKSPSLRWRKPQNAFERFIFQTLSFRPSPKNISVSGASIPPRSLPRLLSKNPAYRLCRFPQSFENSQGSSEYSRSVRRRAVFAKNEAPKQGEPLCMNTFCNKAPRQKRPCPMCGAFFRCPPRTVPVFLHSSLRTPVTRKTRFSFTKKETAKPAKERP